MPCCKGRILVANNSGSRRMIAGSVANNVGLNARQLHLIFRSKNALIAGLWIFDCRLLPLSKFMRSLKTKR
jgi:hypothetical protein